MKHSYILWNSIYFRIKDSKFYQRGICTYIFLYGYIRKFLADSRRGVMSFFTGRATAN